MLRKLLIAFVAGSALTLTGPALAVQEGSGGIWSKRVNSKAKAKAMAEKAREREKAREAARQNSEGPDNASDTGIENASDESVLADAAVDSSALPGLAAGLDVQTSDGEPIGTVSQVVTGADGSIRLVIVTGANGRTIRLLPDRLTISNGVVTTTQAGFGG